MLKLEPNEHVILLIHRHWFVMVRTAILLAAFIIMPFFVVGILPLLPAAFDSAAFSAVVDFVLALYLMGLCLFALLAWMDYYLDMWIITEKRIIDIEQRGLFSRHISEIPMGSVQDVTLQVNGVLETFLKFGTIRIQTAGEREFIIRDIPDLYAVKDAILKYTHGKFDVVTQKSAFGSGQRGNTDK